MAKKPIRKYKDTNQLYYGSEPEFKLQLFPHSNIELISALSYYNIQLSQDDIKNEVLKFAEQFYDKKVIKELNKVKYFSNLGALCRMFSRGCIFEDSNIIHNRIQELLNSVKDITSEDIIVVPKISKKQLEKSNELKYYVSIIQEDISDKALVRNFVKPNFKGIIEKNNIPCNIFKDIANELERLQITIQSAYYKTDKEIVEAYSNYTKGDLKLYIEVYQHYIDNFRTFKKERKKNVNRKKKVIPINKRVEKVKYLVECKELGIFSISPAQIIDKKCVVLYNTRYNTISVLIADKDNKFDIRGTTVYNFDESKSIKKTLRKPSEMLNKILTNKNVDGIITTLNTISTKQNVPVGTINENTLILKVF